MVLAEKYYLGNQFTLGPTEHSTGHTSVPKTMNSQLWFTGTNGEHSSKTRGLDEKLHRFHSLSITARSANKRASICA